jgi:1,4-dihydroxy-6-naphthoate synthase
MDTLIQESVQYAFKNSYETLPEFVKSHSQEMSEQVMRQHINLYVNDFSIQMGEVGKNAIAKLEETYNQLRL